MQQETTRWPMEVALGQANCVVLQDPSLVVYRAADGSGRTRTYPSVAGAAIPLKVTFGGETFELVSAVRLVGGAA